MKKFSYFNRLPIRNKLVFFIVSISVFSCIIALTIDYVLIVKEYERFFKQTIINEGGFIGQSCALPLDFNYPEKANEVLQKTSYLKYFKGAIVYDKNDSLFTEFRSDSSFEFKSINFFRNNQFTEYKVGDKFHILIEIRKDGNFLGTLYLVTELNILEFTNYTLLLTIILVVFVSFLAIILSFYLQNFITSPIVKLSNFAKSISKNNDYSSRIIPFTSDETGILYEEFNNMLDVVEARNTELHSTLSELLIREEQFRGIFEDAPYAITINSIETKKFLDVNSSFNEMTGYFLADLKDRSYLELVELNSIPILRKSVQELLENGFTKTVEGTMLSKSGAYIHILASFSRIQYDNIDSVLTSLVDVTELRKVEKQLKHSQKMDTVGQLAGGVAHDFNNVLGGIIGYSEIIAYMSEGESKISYYANNILSAAKKASELISQLLAFSRKAKTTNQNFDAIEAVNSAIMLLKHSLNKNIEIVTNFQSDQNTLFGDTGLIQNAILNIAINARDAMENIDSGKIVFSSFNKYIDKEYYAKHEYTIIEGHYLEISITDTGCGIPNEIIDSIFDPFFTTKPVGKGTGLGLAAVYGTVKEHKGFINVYSEVGIGTTFNLYFPISKYGIDSKDENINTIYRGQGDILIVDDEPSIREMLFEFLTAIGYDAEKAENGLEALEFCSNKDYDLIILDLIMPKLGGKETLKKLIEIKPEQKVIITSGFNPEGTFDDLLNMGAKSFVKKPFVMSELSKVIKDIISK